MSNTFDDNITKSSQNVETSPDITAHESLQVHDYSIDNVSTSKNFSILESIHHDTDKSTFETDETLIESHLSDIQEILNRNDSQLKKHYVNDKKNWRIEPIFILFFIMMMMITTILLYYTNTYI